MPSPGQELSSIDFESMIGGPLVAVINAQAQAAMSTVNFIKEVGFKKTSTEEEAGGDTSTEEPIYVTFKYPKEIKPYEPAVDANPSAIPPVLAKDAVAAVYEIQELKVPILTILPIPFIRIEETTIDFNAKINSVEYRKTDTSLKIDASLEAKAGWLWGSAKLKVSTSYQRTTSEGNSVNRTYSLAIHVKAVQDEMPAGMEKMLSILESVITSAPASS
ncbi:MAG TPA: DUF2589 domain-containing protein [Nitrososphaerales archaeon]